jgi:hypothetical protein
MPLIKKCPKCGLDLTDTSTSKCPMCGTGVVALPGGRIWIGALVQIALSTAFMLAFGFPKVMIVVFGAVILMGTALSARLKGRQISAQSAPQKPLSRPVLFKVASLAIAVCSFACFSILLFGLVIFLNSWTRWHQYEGQRYERSEFQVQRIYWQKGNRGSISAYASGTVEGNREWMNLLPYLHIVPRSEEEPSLHVSPGTTIPIYFFPGLKGQARVQIVTDPPPAEASRREAMKTLNYAFGGLALMGGILFALVRLRRLCFADSYSETTALSA